MLLPYIVKIIILYYHYYYFWSGSPLIICSVHVYYIIIYLNKFSVSSTSEWTKCKKTLAYCDVFEFVKDMYTILWLFFRTRCVYYWQQSFIFYEVISVGLLELSLTFEAPQSSTADTEDIELRDKSGFNQLITGSEEHREFPSEVCAVEIDLGAI